MKNTLSSPITESSPLALLTLILLVALVGFVSMDIYFPSLPAITKFFNISQGTSQLTLTLFLCGFSFSQLFYGPLSDRFGRRPILLIGFFIYLIGSLGLLITHSITVLLLARLIQGTGAGAGASLCRVLLRDNFVGNKMAQVASYLTIGIALATTLAPALGGYIQQKIGFFGNFFIMFLFGGFTWILVLFFLPETNKTLNISSIHPIIIIKNYFHLLLNKVFMGNMLCSGLAFSGLLVYAIINPFLLQDNLGLSAATYGLITLVIASGELLGTFINGVAVTKIGAKKMQLIGIIIMTLAALSLLLLSYLHKFNLISIVLPTFFVTFSVGIIIPNATAGAFSELKDSIGTAGALYGFFQILVTVVITSLVASIQHQTQWDLGWFFLGLALVSSIIYFFMLLEPVRKNERYLSVLPN